ncbi:hypothetical protein [Microbacterium sp. SD291]|uniref:hypothetical protein n=1 Tax=Microbacterium sp. SD291 TaxID=2782007 RepID=UPI001A971055|nr:hypothetical protein [Microbacterium sp. SD291]MBO0981949.1 hypothetical protein [Microbacterium sp. SD291]
MRSTGPLAAFAATALALSLAGCAGAGGDEGLSYEDSPLNKYLSAAWGGDMSPEEQQKQMDERQREQEELMAECMAEEGFEYTPNLQNGGMVMSGDDIKWEPEKKEWVEKYGYGMVNSPFNEQEMPEPEEYVDPNQEYVESLSESEQQAYYEVAYGVPPTEEEIGEDGSYEYNWEDAGCQGWAQHEIDGEDPWQTDEFADLRKKMEELWGSTQESAEMKDLNAEWAACMEDAGEPGFKTQTEAQMSISDEQSKIYEASYGDGTTPVDTESPEFVDPSQSPEMKALGEREIELALVDLDCRKKTGYAEESLKIQFAREEKFIADNKADLEAFKAAAEQNK